MVRRRAVRFHAWNLVGSGIAITGALVFRLAIFDPFFTAPVGGGAQMLYKMTVIESVTQKLSNVVVGNVAGTRTVMCSDAPDSCKANRMTFAVRASSGHRPRACR